MANTWENLLFHVRFWRKQVKLSQGEPLNCLRILDFNGNSCIFGLGTLANGNTQQTLLFSPLNEEPSILPGETVKSKELKSFLSYIESDSISKENTVPSTELCLYLERIRSQIVHGITSYSINNQFDALLMSSVTQLYFYQNKQLSSIAPYLKGTPLNATMSAFDPKYLAFYSNGKLFIHKEDKLIYVTKEEESITNGEASFIEQEELERIEGFWWNPKNMELLYERVDETQVTQLSFSGMGDEFNKSALMRYPLAGTTNPFVSLRLCRISGEETLDLSLAFDLKHFVSWYEYLARVGWTPDGENVYAVVMNRLQTKLAILLIPRVLFVDSEKSTLNLEEALKLVKIIYQEDSPFWINCNNLLHFLPTTTENKFEFIMGSENKFDETDSDRCQLYCYSYDLDTEKSDYLQLTKCDDISIIKESQVTIDYERKLVYFLASQISTQCLIICVTSYDSFKEYKILTPENMTYKFERNQPSLNINTDRGFVCWLSSTEILPQCRYYALRHSDSGDLPEAEYLYNVVIYSKPSMESSKNDETKSTEQLTSDLSSASILRFGVAALVKPPSKIFTPHFFDFKPEGVDLILKALLLMPAINDPSPKKCPILQAVYGGPSIQMIRDSWFSIAQHLKFLDMGYAVLIIDGRGSANRGVQFESYLKNSLGNLEIEDQVEGLKAACQKFPNLDADRVGVFGWSYGGFASIQLLAKYSKIYKVCCAGGAVFDWTFYDTCYTERYMGLPNNKIKEYNSSGLLPHIPNLPNEDGRLMIIHGYKDENVHFKHIQKLIDALIENAKPYKLVLLPKERHAIRSTAGVEFFHASMLNFFNQALK